MVMNGAEKHLGIETFRVSLPHSSSVFGNVLVGLISAVISMNAKKQGTLPDAGHPRPPANIFFCQVFCWDINPNLARGRCQRLKKSEGGSLETFQLPGAFSTIHDHDEKISFTFCYCTDMARLPILSFHACMHACMRCCIYDACS